MPLRKRLSGTGIAPAQRLCGRGSANTFGLTIAGSTVNDSTLEKFPCSKRHKFTLSGVSAPPILALSARSSSASRAASGLFSANVSAL